MIKQSLHDGWTARAVHPSGEVPSLIRDATIPARVPGCIHTDLLRAGLIEDPYVGDNELKLKWIGLSDWQYTTNFDADPKLFDHERIDLVCDGLDTVAMILLNGSEVAKTQNMHRGYRFDVRQHLRKGRNELTITFASPVKYAEQMRDRLGHLPAIICGGPFNFIRKMACNFGWDWGPIVPTCGIWREVRLEGWSIMRINSVRPHWTTRVPDSPNSIWIDVELERTVPTTDEFAVWGHLSFCDKYLDCSTEFAESKPGIVDLCLAVTDPRLWWPAGSGEQPLYDLKVETRRHTNEPFDLWSGRLGLRTVELDSSPDDIGRKFVVKVNGKPIFCKGFNWIPDDCFLDRACEPARVRKRIQQALDANANMLRVWGGGIYETDEFYSICDELGMLVWQDFLFACAAYPEEEPIKSEVEAEARYNVARLAHHPSLVLWNGCNENLWGYHAWWTEDAQQKPRAWREQLAGRKWGPGYYFEMFPKILAELDPSRPYWAASPWSGDYDLENGLHPNLSTHGNKHIWEVWHGPGDYSNYRLFTPRFCSEFGYQGPANYSTLAAAIPSPGTPGEGQGGGSEARNQTPTPTLPRRTGGGGMQEYLKRGSKFLELHQKSPGGNERNDRLLAKDFEIPEDFDDWHYLLQLNQARALTAGVEWFRSRQPVCMGTLYWQLNDCYPVTSWSAIDSSGQPKPLWFATKRFYAPRLLTIQPEADAHVLYANNDTDEPWRGEALVRRLDFVGKQLAKIIVPIDAPPRSNLRAAVLPTCVVVPTDKSRQLVAADLDGLRATWFFAPDKELVYPAPSPRGSIHRTEDGLALRISTDVLLRDVMINIDRLDPAATINQNLLTLLPGESATFTIRSDVTMTVEQLTTPPVFQCANRFGRT